MDKTYSIEEIGKEFYNIKEQIIKIDDLIEHGEINTELQKERIQEIKQCYTELVDIFNDIFFVSGETGAYFCNLIEQTT